jgi:hypothetical protein
MAMSEVDIRQATVEDLNLLVPLFDSYRRFYLQPSDPEGAREFLRERFRHGDSTIFLAFEDSSAVGFTQLYPSFSSGAMARIFILNDLFVTPEHGGAGRPRRYSRRPPAMARARGRFGLYFRRRSPTPPLNLSTTGWAGNGT